MEGSADPEATGEMEIWGTWEELLLACAVSRHGTRSWDSVAMEVQARSRAPHLLTPHLCRQRYRDLQRRYSANGGCADDDAAPPAVVPWLEELRKLRMAELRRDVERSDVSIVSLQLKVKKLKDEREQSLREAEAGEGSPDLTAREGEEKGGDSPGSIPGTVVAGDSTSGRSCKESNSTDPKEEDDKPDGDAGKPEAAHIVDGSGDADPGAAVADDKAAREASYNGSSDTIAKAAVEGTNPDRPGEAGESGESVAESKGEGKEEKESSDVQSSASLSRRRRRGRRRKTLSGSSSGGDEAAEPAAVSMPLVSFLEIIRSHEYGSVFARRLESQESARYQGTIRRHVDLEMVRGRLERKGGGGGAAAAYTRTEFFRDLLLLCNNAIVFYAKNSPEYSAAVHIRELVSKEMATVRPKATPPLPPAPAVEKERTPPPPIQSPVVVTKAKVDQDLQASLLEKSTSSGPLIACRKRSSIFSKKAAASSAAKEEREEKPETDSHRNEKEIEEPVNLGRRSAKERSTPTGTRGLRTNKGRANSIKGGGTGVRAKNLNYGSSSNANSTPAETNMETAPKGDKKNLVGNGALAKKRSAANFLNRMKTSSPSTNGTLLETLKSSSSTAAGKATVVEQRKSGRGDNRRDVGGSRQAGKQAAVASPPAKRSVGRPPKRAAAPPPKRPRDDDAAPPAKRAREEDAPPPKPPPPRKRGRR